jgi:hypothetical protein
VFLIELLVEIREIFQNGWIFFVGWVVAALELEMALAIWGQVATY